MRIGTAIVVLAIFGAGLRAEAQDPGAMAAQQAMDQAIQANQQATQTMMQSQQINQQASQQAADFPEGPGYTFAPRFSEKTGRYAVPLTVRMKTRSRSAVIYYTTDGWTPTPASKRYVGPIRIAKTTYLQAIAFSPGAYHSLTTSAVYTLPASATPAGGVDEPRDTSHASAIPTTVSLPEGTLVHLEFRLPVSSKTAQVGDTVSLALARDLKVDGILVARKGTPALGRVLMADSATRLGRPGVLQFTVDSLQLAQGPLALRGFEELDGDNREKKAAVLWGTIPPAAIFVHGGEAIIPAGMEVTAQVSKEMTIDMAKAQPAP